MNSLVSSLGVDLGFCLEDFFPWCFRERLLAALLLHLVIKKKKKSIPKFSFNK